MESAPHVIFGPGLNKNDHNVTGVATVWFSVVAHLHRIRC